MNQEFSYLVFRQNNSGGYWIENEDISSEVVIQACQLSDAVAKLEEILAIDSEYKSYCSCCGPRWSPGSPIEYKTVDFKGLDTGHTAILYKADGTKMRIPWQRYGLYDVLLTKPTGDSLR
ncbi:hypothetical protein BN1356_02358 [Streptococcus varani]|uniref:DUF7296 domain-containing protein n=1 Tax=Streptococcus varani TaxID=1608583 RepID=A0A0E4H5T5_9STRE|nr:hypothetical protein [Streptococcus varani]CQR26013.1 hypothetical protein BN1356_02358 [Streptococcus varani]